MVADAQTEPVSRETRERRGREERRRTGRRGLPSARPCTGGNNWRRAGGGSGWEGRRAGTRAGGRRAAAGPLLPRRLGSRGDLVPPWYDLGTILG